MSEDADDGEMNEDKISKLFGINSMNDAQDKKEKEETKKEETVAEEYDPEPKKPSKQVSMVLDNQDENIKTTLSMARDDYEFARKNLRDLVAIGMETVQSAAEIANQSQQSNGYIAVAQIIKSIAETNRELMDLSMKHQKIEHIGGPNDKTINNNLFVGSTHDLFKLLKEQREKLKKEEE